MSIACTKNDGYNLVQTIHCIQLSTQFAGHAHEHIIYLHFGSHSILKYEPGAILLWRCVIDECWEHETLHANMNISHAQDVS